MGATLDIFGKFVMENLRDKAFADADLTIQGHWRAPGLQRLQAELSKLSEEQQDVARRLVRKVVDSAIHDFLFALQEDDDEGEVQVLVGGENVVLESDGLHGEPFGSDGWQARFSEYGEAAEEA